MKLFLDDIRVPSACLNYMKSRMGALISIYSEDWSIVRNYEEFKKAVEENAANITHVSFDHDLADTHYDPETWTESFQYQEETGLDCAKWMKDYYESRQLELPLILVHSMNPVGTKNIINLFL